MKQVESPSMLLICGKQKASNLLSVLVVIVFVVNIIWTHRNLLHNDSPSAQHKNLSAFASHTATRGKTTILQESVRSNSSQSWVNTTGTPRFAYVYIVGGCDADDPTYRNYIYDILISTYNQRQEGSKADVVVLIQIAYKSEYNELPQEDIRLLNAMNIQVQYIPKAPDESFYPTMLDKFRILRMTQYDRIILMDSDVMALGNLDYFFYLSIKGIIKENFVIAGRTEPANGSFFMLAPKVGDWERLLEIIRKRKEHCKRWNRTILGGDMSLTGTALLNDKNEEAFGVWREVLVAAPASPHLFARLTRDSTCSAQSPSSCGVPPVPPSPSYRQRNHDLALEDDQNRRETPRAIDSIPTMEYDKQYIESLDEDDEELSLGAEVPSENFEKPMAKECEHPLTLERTQPLTLEDTQPLTLEDTQPLTLDNVQPFTLEDAQPLTLEDVQSLTEEETQSLPFVEEDEQPLAVEDTLSLLLPGKVEHPSAAEDTGTQLVTWQDPRLSTVEDTQPQTLAEDVEQPLAVGDTWPMLLAQEDEQPLDTQPLPLAIEDQQTFSLEDIEQLNRALEIEESEPPAQECLQNGNQDEDLRRPTKRPREIVDNRDNNHTERYYTIPDYDVVLGSNRNHTMGKRVWDIVRRPYAKKLVEDTILQELKADLRRKLEQMLGNTLPRDPIFWHNVANDSKLKPDSPDKRILESGNRGIFGQATDEAIRQDIRNSSKRNRNKANAFNFQGSPQEVLLTAHLEIQAWIGDDPSKELAAKGFREDLDRLRKVLDEHTMRKTMTMQKAESEVEPHIRDVYMYETRMHEIREKQLGEKFAVLANQFANDMLECYRLLIQKPPPETTVQINVCRQESTTLPQAPCSPLFSGIGLTKPLEPKELPVAELVDEELERDCHSKLTASPLGNVEDGCSPSRSCIVATVVDELNQELTQAIPIEEERNNNGRIVSGTPCRLPTAGDDYVPTYKDCGREVPHEAQQVPIVAYAELNDEEEDQERTYSSIIGYQRRTNSPQNFGLWKRLTRRNTRYRRSIDSTQHVGLWRRLNKTRWFRRRR